MGVFSLNRILRESIAVVCLAGAAFAVVSLASYHPGDPSLNTAWGGLELTPLVWRNQGGRVGAYLADALAQAVLKHLKMFMNDQDGATAAEYALLIGLIAAAIVLTVQGIGTTLDGVFENFDNQLSSMVPPSS